LDTDPFVDRDAGENDEENDGENDGEQYEEQDEEQEERRHTPPILRLDPELVTTKSIQWITRMRIVGLNKESGSGKYCFISGEGTCDDGGVFFACDRTNDPVFPDDDQLAVAPGEVPEFRVCYSPGVRSWPDDGKFFPFHTACYEVLKFLASGRLGDRDNDRDDVDATKLFSYFRYLYSPKRVCPGPSPPQTLELPYIGVDTGYDGWPQEQFWEFRRGEEVCQKRYAYARDPFELMHYACQVYVSNPFKIPKLRKYYENLPSLPEREQKVLLGLKRTIDECGDDDSFQRSHQTKMGPKRQKGDPMHQDPTHSLSHKNASRDPLGRLPPEILAEMFIHLPAQSVVNMKIASPAARHIPLSNWFWWKRIKSAMPCLWDLPSFRGPTGSENIDWHQVYKDLSTQGRGHGHGKILGLVNRHRIWQKWGLRTWFEEKANSAEQDVIDAILEWGDGQSFREWRAARGQTMSGARLPPRNASLHPIPSAMSNSTLFHAGQNLPLPGGPLGLQNSPPAQPYPGLPQLPHGYPGLPNLPQGYLGSPKPPQGYMGLPLPPLGYPGIPQAPQGNTGAPQPSQGSTGQSRP
jgi:hypothetical protein